MKLRPKLAAVLIVAWSAALPTCGVRAPAMRPVPEDAAALAVYLRPLPQDAERLTFVLESVAAVREDGTMVPLVLRLPTVRPGDLRRERLLASGPIPQGAYSGLAIRARSASLHGEQGDADLQVEATPSRVDVPFEAARGGGGVVGLGLRYRDSVSGGFHFTPTFSGETPRRPPVGVVGLVASRESGIVTLFDKEAGTVFGVIPAGREPGGIAVDEIRNRAYVAVSGDDALLVVDLLQGAVIERLRLAAGDRPVDLALTPDRRLLLVANAGSSTVAVVDAASPFELDRIQVGDGPESILVDARGERAFSFNRVSSTISVLEIGISGVRLVRSVATEAEPLRGEMDRFGIRLYVLHGASPYLTVLDGRTLAPKGRVYVGPGAVGLEVDPRAGRIYVAHRGSESVDVYDPASLLSADTLPAGGEVAYLTTDEEENRLVLVLSSPSEVRMMGLVGNRSVARIDVAEGAFRTALAGQR